MKFNSQICTTKEQSQRLLDLGLKSETADMCWSSILTIPLSIRDIDLKTAAEELKFDIIPAWSLHRLLEMICNKGCEEHYYFYFSIDYDSMEDVYDSIIEAIEGHIKDKFFNKEYLK